jgi:lipopolysaccharide transport system ATP-binding protein
MPSRPAIQVRNLSKVYDLGLSGRTRSLASIFTERARHPLRGRTRRERLHALDDVSFDIGEGEAVGVIGKNGAGKSTLLKILSRITPPSSGYIDMKGTVGALLEVGTGFHPELTGMENIFLNGTILGMTRRDIDRRLDEIIAFSEVERFLQTPVKRYSSGMRIRLAFAVAAHLDPEILIVDEILSVGDYAFQAKCLEKMRSIVTEEGRTVLFVSHNLTTVEHFCPRTILMEGGRVITDGPTDQAIGVYFQRFPNAGLGTGPGVFDLAAGDRSGGYRHVLKTLEFRPEGGMPSDTIRTGEWLQMAIHVEDMTDVEQPYVNITVGSGTNSCLFRMTSAMRPLPASHPRPNRETIAVEIPIIPLTPGEYYLNVQLKDATTTVDYVHRAAVFTVLPSDVYGSGYVFDSNDGYFAVPFDWELRPSADTFPGEPALTGGRHRRRGTPARPPHATAAAREA